MCDQRSLPNVVSSLRPTPGIQSTIPFCNAADDHFATDDDSDSDIDLGIDVTEVVDVDVSSDEEVEGEDNSPSQQLHSRDKLNHREAFKATKDHRRASASAAIEYQRNIEAMRVTHEDEKKRFHYREKQQHRKVRKWLNKTLWNVERLETKGDYQPKVLSFSSVLHEVPMKNAFRRWSSPGSVPVSSGVGNSNVGEVNDWTEVNADLDEQQEIMEEEGGEKEEKEVKEEKNKFMEVFESEESGIDSDSSDVSSDESGAFDIVASTTHNLNELSQAHTTDMAVSSPEFSTGRGEMTSGHDSGLDYYVDHDDSSMRYSVDEDEEDDQNHAADHIIQIFTSFDYHGDEEDGIQL